MGFNRKDIFKWFESFGFKNIIIDCVGSNCCVDFKCGCGKVSISIFVVYGEKI